MEHEELLKPTEAAALLGVHPDSVARYAAAGRIGVQRTPGGHRRCLASDVQALVIELTGADT